MFYLASEKEAELDAMTHTFSSGTEVQRQGLCEFKASLVHIASSRPELHSETSSKNGDQT